MGPEPGGIFHKFRQKPRSLSGRKRQPIGSVLKPVIFLALAGLSIWAVFSTAGPENDKEGLKIACSQDAAGLIITQTAAGLNQKVKLTEAGGVSFLQLADCCGSQAEFALAAGKFNLAVLCPDAAAMFLESGKPFVIVGGLVENASVLVAGVHKPEGPFKIVAYSQGRELQKKALAANLGSGLELWAVLPPALPYALEREAVDAVVMDVVNAVKADSGNRCRPLIYKEPGSVLVARRDLLGTPEYLEFIMAYNLMVDDLNGGGLAEALATFLPPERIEEKERIWRAMEVRYLKIEP